MAVGPQSRARITVTRVGTQVVVRLHGEIGEEHAEDLRAAMDDVDRMASRRVAVDLAEVQAVDRVAIDFLASLNGRWQVRHLHTPSHLRGLTGPLGTDPA